MTLWKLEVYRKTYKATNKRITSISVHQDSPQNLWKKLGCGREHDLFWHCAGESGYIGYSWLHGLKDTGRIVDSGTSCNWLESCLYCLLDLGNSFWAMCVDWMKWHTGLLHTLQFLLLWFVMFSKTADLLLLHCYCCSVAKSCLTLWPHGLQHCKKPGFPVRHCLPDFAQTHVHCVSDAIQPSRPLLPPSPLAFKLCRIFSSESALCIS